MKISIISTPKTGSRYPTLVLVTMLAGAGVAAAQTYRHGNSTATIEQSGGSTDSETRIRRYRDGQSIITRDGNSTDITIQREESSPVLGNGGEYPNADFRRRFSGERFSRSDAEDNGDSDAGDDFEQRLHERLHRDFPY